MTLFKKAEAMQTHAKASFYGPPGSGKTFTALLFAEGLARESGKRIAYIDTEFGTKFYASKRETDPIHPAPFDFDVLHTRSVQDCLEAVASIDPDVHGVVVVDSISHIWQAAMEAYEGQQTKIGSIPMHAWSSIKKPYKALIDALIHGPFHAFILGRQKNIFENDASGELRKVGVGMRAEGETEYEPDFCFRFEGIKDSNDSTRTTVKMLVEKDRTSVLSGRTFTNPNFVTIEPLLPLLGTDVIPTEDSEERQAKDAELIAKETEKKKAKEAKSAGILKDFRAQLLAADTLEGLVAVAADLKKQKRYMVEPHRLALLAIYEERRADLVNSSVPEGI